MYVPVLHSRLSEKNAILAIARKIAAAGNVIPLFIPVQNRSSTSDSGERGVRGVVRKFSKEKVPYMLLTTPYMPKVTYRQSSILDILAKEDKNRMARLAVATTATKPISVLRDELNAIPGGPIVILHISESQDLPKLLKTLAGYEDRIVLHIFYSGGCDLAYCDHWKGAKRILVEDGFVRRKNADYALVPNEQFSRVAFEFSADGFDGFGDHTICGEPYSPGGGPAQAVALHLTYLAPIGAAPTVVGIRHFVSDDQTTATPEKVRFFQALNKMLAFTRANAPAFAFSDSCREFEHLAKINHFPKLGAVKRLSIQHHVELMLERLKSP